MGWVDDEMNKINYEKRKDKTVDTREINKFLCLAMLTLCVVIFTKNPNLSASIYSSFHKQEHNYSNNCTTQINMDSETVEWKCSSCGYYNSADRDDTWFSSYKCGHCGASK